MPNGSRDHSSDMAVDIGDGLKLRTRTKVNLTAELARDGHRVGRIASRAAGSESEKDDDSDNESDSDTDEQVPGTPEPPRKRSRRV